MRYEFPEIVDLEPVRKIVLENAGFSIIRRPEYTAVCYAYNSPEVFPEVATWEDAVRRECRGLVFDLEGRLISRPYHKFFNVGERTETMPGAVDLTRPHVILEKLDGSMIRPVPLGGGYRLGTKTGVSLLTPQPEAFVAGRPEYDAFIRHEIARGRTPIFEWCSRQQRIVLDYPDDRLVLTAVRENHSGRYVPTRDVRDEIAADKRFRGIEIVSEHPGTVAGMQALMDGARAVEGGEGFVIRFDDGHMAKLKGDWYVTRHNALDGLSREKVVIETLVSGAADDVKPLLAPEPRARLEAFERRFWTGVESQVQRLQGVYAEVRTRYGDDRKAFALGLAQELPAPEKALMFSALAGKEIRAELVEHIAKNIGTAAKVDYARWAFGGERWDFDFEDDA